MEHYTNSQRDFGTWVFPAMVPHEQLRHYERAFPSVHFHDGMPYEPWTDLQSKIPKTKTRKLADAVEHFNAERLIVNGHNSILTTDPGHNGAVYLSLERALDDSEMKKCVKKVYFDWDNDEPVDIQPPEYEQKPGLLYSPAATPGLYAVKCGTTQSYTNGKVVLGKETFVMKAGRSLNIARRFEDHRTGTDFFSAGGVEFLFGMALAIEDVPRAEGMLHAKMTQFGFAWPMVTSFPRRTCETYKYNSISLPLIHDIFCKLHCVVPPPPTAPLPPLSYFLTLDPVRAFPLEQKFRSPSRDHDVL
ncbi:hypothetical protein P3T76_015346 [Phytophthora citrophthora]|uniref:Uncharacterized protein n=1 Tax=Phytophthora citrophthora TaxID=4793 RepID=A0AAD9G075_9STRA|nr:hypothetical protein P3T76_015346 [Phytophthora citrophthora]